MTMVSERERRWRLILGRDAGQSGEWGLTETDMGRDEVLSALYGEGDEGGEAGQEGRARTRSGGLGASAPRVARWLGDIRQYFPTSVVRVMQQDAMERLNLRQMLLEPELLATVEPDVHLAATLLTLNTIMPAQSRATARQVVRRVVDELERRLTQPMRQAVSGALNRGIRNRRPRLREIDWPRTIRANLKHYQPELRTIVPQTLIGFGRRRMALRDVILCIDQSGSMAASVVYAGVFGAVLASLPSVRTHVVAFDTAVIDLTAELHDPVELLFGTQLGGGTDIHQALTYCQGLVQRPQDTILVLISDLYEGGPSVNMLRQAAALTQAGVQMVALLALSDQGAPGYQAHNAAALAALGVPAFACTPDLFPDLMAAALQRQNLTQWAATHELVVRQ